MANSLKNRRISSVLNMSPKVDLHFDVKFDGECDGDGPES